MANQSSSSAPPAFSGAIHQPSIAVKPGAATLGTMVKRILATVAVTLIAIMSAPAAPAAAATTSNQQTGIYEDVASFICI